MSTSDSRTTSSSRLSQFGLYRTIDARTEEFLRLSRKRQIRQGCACAAVSTAITVTVVVTVLLVYEYSISPSTNTTRKFVRKPTWLGLFNDSALENKFNQANINVDQSTFKLLPLLLKSLHHNSYLSNILEDSGNNITVQGVETTEYPYERNIFTNARNWIKTPKKSNEYKTLPVVSNKNQIMTADEYGKAKKLRDYQKMFNYFDKVIASATLNPISKIRENYEENDTRHDSILDENSNGTESPLKIKFILPQNKRNINSVKSNTTNCKCLLKISEFLEKLVTDIQNFASQFKHEPKMYNKNETKKVNDTDKTTDDYYSKSKQMSIEDTLGQTTTTQIPPFETTSTKIIKTTTAPLLTTMNSHTSTEEKMVKHTRPTTKYINLIPMRAEKLVEEQVMNEIYAFKETKDTEKDESTTSISTNAFKYSYEADLQDFILKNILKSSYGQNNKASDSHNIDKFTRLYFHRQPSTTIKSSAVPTDATAIHKTSTEPISSYINMILNFKSINTSTPSVLTTTTTREFTDGTKRSSIEKTTLPLVIDYEENDSDTTSTTARNIIDDLEKLDIHTIELFKGKLLPKEPSKPKSKPDGKVNKLKVRKKPKYEIVKQGTLEPKLKKNITEFEDDVNSNIIMPTLNYTQKNERENNSTTEKPLGSDTTVARPLMTTAAYVSHQKSNQNISNSSIAKRDELSQKNQMPHQEDVTDEDVKPYNEGDMQDQEVLKEAVDVISKPVKLYNKDKSILPNFYFAAGTGPDLDALSDSHPNSMLPENRPTYLEINRNDWKQDNHDYTTGDIVPYEFI